MMFAFLITFIFITLVGLVFFKFKWLKFTKTWGIISLFFAAHLFLILIVGLRFVTPYSANLTVIQYTVQLIPRLPEPTIVTAVLVQPDVHVKKGQPLFQFDRRSMKYQVRNWRSSEVEIRDRCGRGRCIASSARSRACPPQVPVTVAGHQHNRG